MNRKRICLLLAAVMLFSLAGEGLTLPVRAETPEKSIETGLVEAPMEVLSAAEQPVEATEPAEEESAAEKSVVEEPVGEESAAEKSVVEEPVGEKSVAEEPLGEEPVVEKSVAEEPTEEKSAEEKSVVEEPAAEKSVVEEPAAEESVVEEPAAEKSVAEEPTEEKSAEEKSVVEEPAAEESVEKESVKEEPAAEESVEKEPVKEEPAAEKSVAEEPVEAEPAAEKSVAEEPVAEEPVGEEPAEEKSVVEEPAAEKSVAEEPAEEKSAVEEPAAEESVEKEPAEEESTEEEPAEEEIEEVQRSVSAAAADGASVAISGTLPTDAVAVIQPMTITRDELKSLMGEKAADVSRFALYDISVMRSDRKYEITSAVEVQLSGVKDAAEWNNVHVMHLAGTEAEYPAVQLTETGILFGVSHFSLFLLYEEDPDYTGLTYSLRGKDSVTLSELFSELGVIRDAKLCPETELTDDTLLSAGRGTDGDWTISVLRRFSTAEELAVLLPGDKIVRITLTDRPDVPVIVGDRDFASLHEAFAGAGDGETVTLLQDLSLPGAPTIDLDGRELTLDFNGHHLTTDSELFLVREGKPFTLSETDVTFGTSGISYAKKEKIIVTYAGGFAVRDEAGQNSDGSLLTGSVGSGKLIVAGLPPVLPQTGDLSVSERVEGSSAERNKEFSFLLTLSDPGISGLYGDMTFSGGVASFTLRSGEIKTAAGLPAGVFYSVTQADYSAEGYSTEKKGNAGSILAGERASAEFVNERSGGGELCIRTTVTGDLGDKTKEFTYRVDFTAQGSYPCGSGTIASGEKVTLRHGESVTITGLPAGTIYLVTAEKADGYTARSTGAAGTVAYGTTSTATFTHNRSSAVPTGDTSTPVPWFCQLWFSFLCFAALIPDRKERRARRADR